MRTVVIVACGAGIALNIWALKALHPYTGGEAHFMEIGSVIAIVAGVGGLYYGIFKAK